MLTNVDPGPMLDPLGIDKRRSKGGVANAHTIELPVVVIGSGPVGVSSTLQIDIRALVIPGGC
jgi:hypothetical protein